MKFGYADRALIPFLFAGLLFFGTLSKAQGQSYESLDLVDLQMQLRVLDVLGHRGYFITQERIQRLRDAEAEATSQFVRVSSADLKSLSRWVDQKRESQAAIDTTVEKMALKFGEKIIKAAAMKQKGRGSNQAVGVIRAWRQNLLEKVQAEIKHKKKASAIADYVIQLGSEHGATVASTTFTRQVREQVYRGAIKDKLSLVQGIRDLEQQQVELDGCIKALNEVVAGLEKLEKAKRLQKHIADPVGFMKGQMEQKVTSYLMERYPGTDKASLKSAVGKVRKVADTLYSLNGKVRELQSNDNLLQHPDALQTATGFLVMGTACKSVLGMVRGIPAAKSIAPLFSVLEYYAEAFLLVPKVAKKLERIFQSHRQEKLGEAFMDAWAPLQARSSAAEPLFMSTLMKRTQVPVAEAHGLPAPYYLMVPEKKPKQYQALTTEEYERLERALSAERILHADSDVSWFYRSEFDFNMIWNADANALLSEFSGKDYVDRLKEVAKEPLPIFSMLTGNLDRTPNLERHQRMVALAEGKSITLKGKTWTAKTLDEAATEHIAKLADEMSIRSAIGSVPEGAYRDWRDFRELIEHSGMGFGPTQLLRLFSNYYHTEPKGHALRKFLSSEERRRDAMQVGIPSVGLPLVHERNTMVTDEAQVATVTTTVIVEGMAPNEKVDGEIRWKTADGTLLHRHSLELSNGANQFSPSFRLSDVEENAENRVDIQAEVIANVPDVAVAYVQDEQDREAQDTTSRWMQGLGLQQPIVSAQLEEQFELDVLTGETRAREKLLSVLEGFSFQGEHPSKIEIRTSRFVDGHLFIKGVIGTTAAVVPENTRGLSGGTSTLCHGISHFRMCLRIHPTTRQCQRKAASAMKSMRKYEDAKTTTVVEGMVTGDAYVTKIYPHLFFLHDSLNWTLGPQQGPQGLGHASGTWNGRVNESRYSRFAYGCLFVEQYDFSVCVYDLRFTGLQRQNLRRVNQKRIIPLLRPAEANRFCQEIVQRANKRLVE